MLATTYFSAAATTVLRWTAEAFARLPRSCSATLARYAKMMGCVDRFNRTLALTNMAMGQCKQRFHRALFLGWLLPGVGVINVMIIFIALWPADEMAELKKSRRCPTLGFPRWFQQQLGEALIEYGVRMAKQELGEVDVRTELGLSPSFMPKDVQRQATGFESYTFPQNHKQIFDSRVPEKNTVGRITMPGHHACARCSALAQRDGEVGYYHLAANATSNWKVRKMPLPWAIGADGKPIHNIPSSRWGCSICKVWLCKDCFRMEDAQGKPLPNAWDHRAATRGLLARCVPCE
jgi:hypothetical protein